MEASMIKLGCNSVLFDAFDFATAAKYIAAAGYDGIEVSAIKGMCEHLEVDKWKEGGRDVARIAADNGLALLSMEFGGIDEQRLEHAFEAAAGIGIPIVNVGPGGKTGDAASLRERIALLARMAERAAAHGVTLCVKAHVGQAIFDTPTTLEAIKAIKSPAFGIDMDPSHVYRAGENPEEALAKVLSRVRHIHIRDCPRQGGERQGPGDPPMQACGRGDIDLAAYCRAMVKGGYGGPVCLEVIGAKKAGLDLASVAIIAAESYGYLNASLKALGAR
jgi:sugar phosphate isomerase/epimerase